MNHWVAVVSESSESSDHIHCFEQCCYIDPSHFGRTGLQLFLNQVKILIIFIVLSNGVRLIRVILEGLAIVGIYRMRTRG